MNATIICLDALATIRKLEDAGFTQKQAETQTQIYLDLINWLVNAKLATKDDLKDLSEQFCTKADLKADLRATEIKLSDKIYSTETKLRKEIRHTEDKLVKKINGVETTLTDKINSVETKLTDKINGIDTKLTNEMNGVDKKFNNLERRMDKIDSRMDRLQQTMECIEGSIAYKLTLRMGAMFVAGIMIVTAIMKL